VLLGRVPSERHEHYDPEGNLTGFTIVVRDPEWTDSDVRELLELADVEATSCPGCGWHESFTDDRAHVFAPENRYCPLCAGTSRFDRMLAAQDKKWDERHKDASPAEPRPADGRGPTHMTLLRPEEAQRRRGGEPPSPHAPNA
jgi:hypothetical protein